MRRLLTSSCLWLAFVPIGGAQEWPKTFQPAAGASQVKNVTKGEDGFRYETKSYRIKSATKLERALLDNFAASAESVAVVMKEVPLPLFAPSQKSKPLIEITTNEEAYRKTGGAPGTAGYYDGRSGRVIVQWEQLNRTPANSGLLPQPAFDLLVHELTHLCMGKWTWKMEPWLVEGTAEYFAAAHLSKGRFDFTKIESHIRDHVRKLTPPKAQQVTTLSVSKLLRMSSRDWHTRTENLPPGEALLSYTSSLLLTHYAFHGGAERRKEVRSYLEALDKVSFVHEEKPRLFSPADAMEIESKIKTYWKLKGLRLDFQ